MQRLDSMLYIFFFQAEDGIRDLVRSRGLGDVYKRQVAASGSYVVALDNLSGIREELSDALCRAATGEGLSLIHI